MLGIVQAQPTSNTVFIENGLTSNTFWNVNVYSFQTTSYNHNFNTTGNTITTNVIPFGSYFFTASTSNKLFYGALLVGANNLVNFVTSPVNTSVSTSSFSSCISLGANVCVPFQGNVPVNATGLQNKVIGPPYSANLTIYLNQQGFFEYIINNGTSVVQPSLFQNIPPGELILPQLNLTSFNKVYSSSFNSLVTNTPKLNSSYVGAIYYSQLIDIAPIERQMLEANLTPYSFFYWSELNSPFFYNTTLVFQTRNPGIISSAILGTSSITALLTGLAINPVFGLLSIPVLSTAKQTVLTTIQGEISVPQASAIPISLSNIPNATRGYQLYVDYAYPNVFCLAQLVNGICVQHGVQGMLNFNTYFDNTYAPQVALSQFMTQGIPELFIITFALFIIKKLNGW